MSDSYDIIGGKDCHAQLVTEIATGCKPIKKAKILASKTGSIAGMKLLIL
jgi:hypothetical protein